jgi:hypothetical protein
VHARLADLPAGETLQILEVGAGTGGTTAFVLEALAPFADRIRYVFTDIGTFFLDAARPRFADYPFVTRPWISSGRRGVRVSRPTASTW